MSQHDTPKQKSVLIYIFPVAVLLTGLFIYRNRSAVHELERLDGNVKRIEVKATPSPVHHVVDTVHTNTHAADTGHVAPAAHPAGH